jgi:hypothetical protein
MYVHRRGRFYYFKRKIPADLMQVFGDGRDQMWKALGTSLFEKAKVMLAVEVSEFDFAVAKPVTQTSTDPDYGARKPTLLHLYEDWLYHRPVTNGGLLEVHLGASQQAVVDRTFAAEAEAQKNESRAPEAVIATRRSTGSYIGNSSTWVAAQFRFTQQRPAPCAASAPGSRPP